MDTLIEQLFNAVDSLNEQAILCCIKKGADLNTLDKYGFSVFARLTMASRLNFSYNEIGTKEQEGQMLEEDLKKIEFMKLLISYGSDVNLYDEDGHTALDISAGQAKVEVVKFLLESGSNPNFNFYFPDEPGCENVHSSILHTALSDVSASYLEDVSVKYEKIVLLLQKHGAVLYKT